MLLFEYYKNLREELIALIRGTSNSSSYYLRWDTSNPNYLTNKRIETIFEKYIYLAEEFGMYLVIRHCECLNHEYSYILEHSNKFSSTRMLYEEFALIMHDRNPDWICAEQLYTGRKYCKCPCSVENTMTEHDVIQEVVFDSKKDIKVCEALHNIMKDISMAINKAGDNRPRSGIREYLLLALIKINDELLPEPMNEYIQNKQV